MKACENMEMSLCQNKDCKNGSPSGCREYSDEALERNVCEIYDRLYPHNKPLTFMELLGKYFNEYSNSSEKELFCNLNDRIKALEDNKMQKIEDK